MRVVHVYDGHEKVYNGRGSVPGVVWNVARETAYAGHDVTIIERQWDGLPKVSTHDGVDFRRLDIRTGADEPWERIPYEQVSSPSSLARLVGDRMHFAGQVLRVLRKRKYDVLHVHLPFAANVMLAIAPWLGQKTVYTAHLGELRLDALDSSSGDADSDDDDLGGHSKTIVDEEEDNQVDTPGIIKRFSPDVFLANRAAQTTVLNPNIRATFVEKGVSSESISVVPNGVAFGQFANVPETSIEDVREQYSLNDSKVVLFVGTLMPRKGVTDLIEAFSTVFRTVDDVKLVIAGETTLDSSYAHRVRSLIAEHGLSESVTLTGFVPDNELRALYSAADVSVVPSYEEGFGMTAVESLAAGTPVVGTRVGGLPRVLTNEKAGTLVEVGDVVQLATAITTILENVGKRERMSEYAIERAQSFSWRGVADQFIEHYEEIQS